MRIYAAQCSEVIDPLRELLEDRGIFVVDEDVADDGDIEMELARGGGFGKRSKARGWVELNQGSGRCTVIIELQQKDPVFGGWGDTAWNEKNSTRHSMSSSPRSIDGYQSYRCADCGGGGTRFGSYRLADRAVGQMAFREEETPDRVS